MVKLSLVLWITCSLSAMAQPKPVIDLARGEKLYKLNCASCHGINKKKLGPNLPDSAGIKMDKIDPTWIFRWIRNSRALVQAHDTTAVKVFAEYHQIEMPSFPEMTDDDIRSIGAYTMKERLRLDSLKQAEEISAAIANTKQQLTDPTSVNSYLTITHAIVGAIIFIFMAVIIVIMKVFNLITFQLSRDETELRRLRKLSQEHKTKSK